jgi:hypothetical protein
MMRVQQHRPLRLDRHINASSTWAIGAANLRQGSAKQGAAQTCLYQAQGDDLAAMGNCDHGPAGRTGGIDVGDPPHLVAQQTQIGTKAGALMQQTPPTLHSP